MLFAPRMSRLLATSPLPRREVRSGAAGLPGFGAGLPTFVGGISLGGCIAFNAALADREAGSGLFRCALQCGAGGGGQVGIVVVQQPRHIAR